MSCEKKGAYQVQELLRMSALFRYLLPLIMFIGFGLGGLFIGLLTAIVLHYTVYPYYGYTLKIMEIDDLTLYRPLSKFIIPDSKLPVSIEALEELGKVHVDIKETYLKPIINSDVKLTKFDYVNILLVERMYGAPKYHQKKRADVVNKLK